VRRFTWSDAVAERDKRNPVHERGCDLKVQGAGGEAVPFENHTREKKKKQYKIWFA
jgi:hypothetical protein